MNAIPACRYLRPMQSAPLTEIEREVVDDILAVCRRCGWPTDLRPGFQAYLAQGGRLLNAKQLKSLGGWKRLCALAGMMRGTHTAAVHVGPPAARATFDEIVADVREVAQALRLKPGAPLTRAVYHRSGGQYWGDAIAQVGGWAKLSAAAGHPSHKGFHGVPRHQWVKTQPALSQRELDAALNAAVGHTPIRRGFLCLVKGRPRGRRGPKTVYRQVPALERGEIIADIREIALSAGLDSPRLLTFATYRAHGGRYTFDQAATFGGFDTLRRVA
jgi:hypothetical protein